MKYITKSLTQFASINLLFSCGIMYFVENNHVLHPKKEHLKQVLEHLYFSSNIL